MRRPVAIVVAPLDPNTLPVTSGYLQAYANGSRKWRGAAHSSSTPAAVSHPTDEFIRELVELDCDVHGFSCFLCNMRRVSATLQALLRPRPRPVHSRRPQLMNRLPDYIAPTQQTVVAADSDGQITFAAYLHQLLTGEPDFGHVPGINSRTAGDLITTAGADRIKDSDEVPSPFAAGVFDGTDHGFSVVETNRHWGPLPRAVELTQRIARCVPTC